MNNQIDQVSHAIFVGTKSRWICTSKNICSVFVFLLVCHHYSCFLKIFLTHLVSCMTFDNTMLLMNFQINNQLYQVRHATFVGTKSRWNCTSKNIYIFFVCFCLCFIIIHVFLNYFSHSWLVA